MNVRSRSARLLLVLCVLFAAGCGRFGPDSKKKEDRPARKVRSGQMGGLVEDAYLEDLKSGDAAARRSAARELGNLRAKRAAPALEAATKDEDASVRKEAQAALEKLQQAK